MNRTPVTGELCNQILEDGARQQVRCIRPHPTITEAFIVEPVDGGPEIQVMIHDELEELG